MAKRYDADGRWYDPTYDNIRTQRPGSDHSVRDPTC